MRGVPRCHEELKGTAAIDRDEEAFTFHIGDDVLVEDIVTTVPELTGKV